MTDHNIGNRTTEQDYAAANDLRVMDPPAPWQPASWSGGIALGSFDTSSVFDRFTNANADATAATGDAEEAASWAIIGLTSALVASALGSKMWPRCRVTEIHS